MGRAGTITARSAGLLATALLTLPAFVAPPGTGGSAQARSQYGGARWVGPWLGGTLGCTVHTPPAVDEAVPVTVTGTRAGQCAVL